MRKIESLQALRALAFLGIFLNHAGCPVYWSELGVSIFFVLSGFLSYINTKDYDSGLGRAERLDYTKGKISKIYQLHILTMILAIILAVLDFGSMGNRSRAYVVIKAVLNTFLVQSWMPDLDFTLSLNGVAWFLSTAAFLYYLFPKIAHWVHNRKNGVAVGIGFALLALQLVFCIILLKIPVLSGLFTWASYCFPVFRLVDLYFGITLGKLYLDGCFEKMGTVTANILEIIALVLSAACCIWIRMPSTNIFSYSTRNMTTIYILPAALWILAFTLKKGVITGLLSNRLLIWVGNISPYLFLIHFVVIRYVEKIMILTGTDAIAENGVCKALLIVFELALSTALTVLAYRRVKKHGYLLWKRK